MKKIYPYAVKTAAVAAVIAIYCWLDLGNEINQVFRDMTTRVLPWVSRVFYS